eukprot:g13366.t1
MLTELRSKELQRNQLQMQVEHDKQLILVGQEAVRSEQLVEQLRNSYEKEVETLKSQRVELVEQNKDGPAAREASRAQQRQVEVSQQQSEMLLAVLEKLGGPKEDAEDFKGQV